MNWNDITISQYKRIVEADKMIDQALDKTILILAIVLNKEVEEVESMPIPEYKKHLDNLSFINTPVEPGIIKRSYVINGKEYKLTMNAELMTAGQYIDYSNTLSDDPDNVSLLLAILLVPKSAKQYGNGYDISELSKEIEDHFKITDAYGISFFFTQAFKALTGATLQYLEKKLKKEKKKEKNQEKIEVIQKSINSIQQAMRGISQ